MRNLSKTWTGVHHLVQFKAGSVTLEGNLSVPDRAKGLVIFIHGSGSSRYSPRNQLVAGVLNTAGLGTLLFDLLTPEEERTDITTAQWRFDVGMLSERVVDATKWVIDHDETAKLPIGYFGASTGAAAALVASTVLPDNIKAIVSRGGRPDLAASTLSRVTAPTLLIVGGRDMPVIDLNSKAIDLMTACRIKKLEIVPRATHLFEEAGTLEKVADLAAVWFHHYVT